MMRLGTALMALLLAGSTGAATACGGGSNAPQAAAATATSSGASAGEPTTVNIAEVFPPGPGRDLVLQNCQSCHTIVPIVVLQMNRDQWARNSLDHRERVPALSAEDFASVYEYLMANFNPDRPVPELPKALLETWTGY